MPWPTTTTFLKDCMSQRLGSRYCRYVASCEAAITVCSPWRTPGCERGRRRSSRRRGKYHGVVLARLHARHRVARRRRRGRGVRRRGRRRRGDRHRLGNLRRIRGADHRVDEQRDQDQRRHPRSHHDRSLVMPVGLVVIRHGAMLCPALEHLLCAGRQRALQERPEADPADAERPERCGVVLIG